MNTSMHEKLRMGFGSIAVSAFLGDLLDPLFKLTREVWGKSSMQSNVEPKDEELFPSGCSGCPMVHSES